jgi:hypothetical protein
MTAHDFDDKDAHFTGVLAQHLKPGEDPKWKLPALCKALGASDNEELAVRYAIELKVPGFTPEVRRRRKRSGRGRPDFVSLTLEAANVDAPGFYIERLKEKLLRRMEVILAEGQVRNIMDAACRVLEEPRVDGDYNPLFVAGSTQEARNGQSKSALYLQNLYTHRNRHRAETVKAGHPAEEMLCRIYSNVLSLSTSADCRWKIHRMFGACTRLDTTTGCADCSFELTLRPAPGFIFDPTVLMLDLDELRRRARTWDDDSELAEA